MSHQQSFKMGISLQQYRCRIGSFLPKHFYYLGHGIQEHPVDFKAIYFALVIFIWNFCRQISAKLVNTVKCIGQSDNFKNAVVGFTNELGNFYARYTNANGQSKGLKIVHANKGPGHLCSKIHDIEYIIEKYKPHVLGISEANFMKNHDPQEVALKDYHLFTCPTLRNPDLEYSRVVVYAHNSVVCKVRMDLMDSDTSTIWLQIGLPRQKQILLCNIYREWQLLTNVDNINGSNSIHDQLNRWSKFLDQWERALDTGMETIVCGDVNINHLDWTAANHLQSSQTK